jgi:hypothetical protein
MLTTFRYPPKILHGVATQETTTGTSPIRKVCNVCGIFREPHERPLVWLPYQICRGSELEYRVAHVSFSFVVCHAQRRKFGADVAKPNVHTGSVSQTRQRIGFLY